LRLHCACTCPRLSSISSLSLHDALPILRSILFLAIVKSLHSISLFPSVVAPQTFDGFEMGHRVFFDGKRPPVQVGVLPFQGFDLDRKSTRLNSSHVSISYAVFCLRTKRS